MAITVRARRLRDARTVLLLFIGLTVAALILQTWWAIAQDRHLTIDWEQRSSLATVRALDAHSSRLLTEAEHAIDGAAAALRAAGGPSAALEPAMHAALQGEIHRFEAIADLWLASPDGELIASSARFPADKADAALRNAIGTLLARPAERRTMLGLAYRRKADGEWLIPFARAIHDARGNRIAIIGASMRAKSFVGFFTTITGVKPATVTFRTNEGVLLVRSPFDESAFGKDMSPSPVAKRIAAGAQEGSFEDRSAFDATLRLFAYRKSDFFPVTTTYSRETAEVLAAWKSRTTDRLLHAGGTLFLIAILTAFLLFHIKRLQESEASLAASENRYRTLYDSATDGVLLIDRKRILVDCNDAAVSMLGLPGKPQLIGRSVEEFSAPAHLADRSAPNDWQRLLEWALAGQAQNFEWPILRNGKLRYGEVTLGRAGSGEEELALCLIRDINARKQAEEIQKGQNRILHFIAAGTDLQTILNEIARFVEQRAPHSRCMMLLLNDDRTRFSWGAGPGIPDALMLAMSGMRVLPGGGASSEAVLSQYPVMIEQMDTHPLMHDTRDLFLRHGFLACGCWPIMGKRGQILGAFSMLYGEHGMPTAEDVQLVGISTDLAGIAIESRWAEERIRHLAHYDELTGLPNRFLYIQHLNRALARAERNQFSLGVLFLDLDRFKNINDTFGHDAGDAVLRSIAVNFRACLRECDTIARVGGDEFIVLIDHYEDSKYLGDIAERLLVEATKPFDIHGQECQLSVSIGIAAYPLDGSSAQMLLKNADIAMYRAKATGKNNYQFYSSEMNTHTVERLAFETRLRRAIERREFVTHFQPKIDARTGRIVGAEALVRWMHPELGLLLPGAFIALAEEAGLVGQIGMIVLEQACKSIAAFRDAGIDFGRVAINLSAAQFNHAHLLEDLQKVVDESGTEPSFLEFEITESTVMHNRDQAIQLLDEIRGLGFTLSIDDFGTGYSSLTYLKRFPVHSVKIDKSFINDIPRDANDLAIVQAIIVMTHTLGLKVVAEGVETITQLKTLQDFGCDEFQGFYFSKALPESDFIALARSQMLRSIA